MHYTDTDSAVGVQGGEDYKVPTSVHLLLGVFLAHGVDFMLGVPPQETGTILILNRPYSLGAT